MEANESTTTESTIRPSSTYVIVSGTTTTSGSNVTSSVEQRNMPKAAIVGGVIGGIVFIAVIVIIIWCCRRRNKDPHRKMMKVERCVNKKTSWQDRMSSVLGLAMKPSLSRKSMESPAEHAPPQEHSPPPCEPPSIPPSTPPYVPPFHAQTPAYMSSAVPTPRLRLPEAPNGWDSGTAGDRCSAPLHPAPVPDLPSPQPAGDPLPSTPVHAPVRDTQLTSVNQPSPKKQGKLFPFQKPWKLPGMSLAGKAKLKCVQQPQIQPNQKPQLQPSQQPELQPSQQPERQPSQQPERQPSPLLPKDQAPPPPLSACEHYTPASPPLDLDQPIMVPAFVTGNPGYVNTSATDVHDSPSCPYTIVQNPALSTSSTYLTSDDTVTEDTYQNQNVDNKEKYYDNPSMKRRSYENLKFNKNEVYENAQVDEERHNASRQVTH